MPDTTAYNLSRTGTISSLFFKNLWVLFSAIFVVSLIGTLFTTYLFMKSTAVESTRFLADDLTSQLNTVYSLLEGMSEQPLIKDTSIPVQERRRIHENVCGRFRLLDDRRRRSRRDHFEHLAAQNRQGASAATSPASWLLENGKSAIRSPPGPPGT